MRNGLMLLVATILLVVMAPASASERGPVAEEVRANITQAVGDSITFRVRWGPAQRGRLQAPVEGYEVQIVAASLEGAGRIAGTDTVMTSAAVFTSDITVFHDCADERNIYRGRVRALGQFSESAPWTDSNATIITCDNTPPIVPDVEADTLPVDTLSSEPDDWDTVLEPLASWVTLNDGGAHSSSMGAIAKLCAFSTRDGVRRKAGWQTNVRPRVTMASGVVPVVQALDGVQACWSLTFLPEVG